MSKSVMTTRWNRQLVVVLSGISLLLVYFHRSAIAVLYQELSDFLHVPVVRLSKYSSGFFLLYSLIQPFGGIISDEFNPKYLLCIACILFSLCSILTGIVSNYTVSAILRGLMGLGCGPVYVGANKLVSVLFSKEEYVLINGVFLGIGFLGGLLSQAPLAYLVRFVDWKSVYISIGCIGIVIGLLFLAVSVDFEAKHESFINKFKVVLTNGQFWLMIIWTFFCSSTYFNFTSFWAGPYIRNVFGVDMKYASWAIVMMSIACIVGSPFFTWLSNKLETRKYIILFTTISSVIITAAFCFIRPGIPTAVLFAILFFYGLFSGATISIAAPIYKEMFTLEYTATAVGCSNFFPFFSTTILQNLIPFIVSEFDDPTSFNAYRYGLWVPSVIYCSISLIGVSLVKDTFKNNFGYDKL